MKLFKKLRKGFTLIELVVVIAVIAILAAVSVVSYVSITNKAKQSNDQQKIDQVNLSLAALEVSGAPETMYKAVKAVEEDGFKPENFKAEAKDYTFAYAMEENRFVIWQKSSVVYPKDMTSAKLGANLWFFADSTDGLNDGFSHYLRGSKLTGTAVVKAGLDVGENKDVSVTYTSSSSEDVIFRTNGGTLSINNTNAESHQYHYGTAASVVVSTGAQCYEGHAVVASMTVNAGKAVAGKGAYIGLVQAASGVSLEEKSGVFVIPTNADPDDIPATIAQSIGYENTGDAFVPSADKASKSYYVVGSAEDLTNFVDLWNGGDEAIQSIKSIKFAANVVYDYENQPWTPLGTWEYPFNGTIDGMGCTIKGMGIIENVEGQGTTGSSTGITGEAYGLIGIAGGGDVVVKNINFSNLNIEHADGNMVGAVIGFAPSNKKFTTSDGHHSFVSKWAGNTTIGTHNVTISDITVSGKIVAKQDAAGLAGKLYNSGKQTVENCVNNATITATVGDSGRAAGLVSMVNGSKEILVKNCSNNGNVTAHNWAAGVVGYASNAKGTIQGCSNVGALDAALTNAYVAFGAASFTILAA